MTRAPFAAAVLALGAALSGCGGGPPTDASREEFCEAQDSLFADLDHTGAGGLPSDEDLARAFREWGQELEEVGTPAGIPDDARAGFEEAVTQAQAAEGRDFAAGDPGAGLGDLSEEAADRIEAFTSYAAETCGALPEVPELPPTQ